jgi:carboxypeptidase family protein
MQSQFFWRKTLCSLYALLLLLLAIPSSLFAQVTVATGSIEIAVSDPTGAVLQGAKVSATNASTGQKIATISSSAGLASINLLIPGQYKIQIEAKGFQQLERDVVVEVGTVTAVSARLSLGAETQVVQVSATQIQVNTGQSSIRGVLNKQQIEDLPINGRNFLDLAQLEPGVQIQDGTNFDPTKVGYSSISFGGRFGRSARIEVDGVDVSDETVGTTTQDIPQSAIQEFQLNQSVLDLSTELTSSGAVNVVTRSGGNSWHGQAFSLFRDSAAAAALPAGPGLNSPFQRSQSGGRFGGPIKKDKFFFFVAGERTKQDLQAAVALPEPFTAFSGNYSAPFRENEALARLDYQLKNSARLFYRFTYFDSSDHSTFWSSSFQVYSSKNYSRDHAIGLDFMTGSFFHSIRASFLNFQNNIADATQGSGLPLANLPVSLVIGPLQTGANLLAPQFTLQNNRQVKYDGVKIFSSHILSYGIDYNHILDVGNAAFFGAAPQAQIGFTDTEKNFADNSCGPGVPCFAGGHNNPLNYPVELVLLGTGNGYVSEKPGLGYRAGGLGPDNRLGMYIGDKWTVKSNLTVNFGVRYVRDTGRSDSDLPGLPELAALGAAWAKPVKQPNLDFAPQFGFAYDPWNDNKTVIRGAIGMFYDNAVFNNVYGDRPFRLESGTFQAVALACVGPGVAVPVPTASQTLLPTFCGSSSGIAVGQVAQQIGAFQSQLQALSQFSLTAPNPSYAGNLLAQGINIGGSVPGSQMLGPDFHTPRATQMNIGVEREIARNTVVSVDYVRNVATQLLLGVDQNHVGDIRYFDKSAALAAISSTNGLFGCGSGTDAASINCAIANGAQIADYARNGMGSPALDFGGSCPIPTGCAFSGVKANLPQMIMANSTGRSVYNALQAKLRQQVDRPMPGIRRANLQLSYSLSRFVSAGAGNYLTLAQSDLDLVNNALDNAQPMRYMGPNLLDRTHQFSFGGTADLRFGFSASVVSHFYSALPLPLIVPNSGLGPGEIYRTDFTGDGTVGDPLPGTKMGSFGRGVSASDMNKVLQTYNSTIANQATPAGQTLINNGLLTLAQLQALGGVASAVPLAPSGQVNVDWLRSCDMKLEWKHTFHEKYVLKPSVGAYNLFNFANFDLPPGTMSPLLNGSPGSINGTTYKDRAANRVGVGTGVFSLASPRVFEFGLKFDF